MTGRMKKVLILILILFSSCESKNEKDTIKSNDLNKNVTFKETKSNVLSNEELKKNSKDLEKILKSAYNYNPTSVTFRLDDSLNSYDLKYLFQNTNSDIEIKDEISKILLLKLLKFQYERSQHSYNVYNDLGDCCSENAKSIIKHYLKRNNIDTVAVDVLPLGNLLDREWHKKNSEIVSSLIKDIDSLLEID